MASKILVVEDDPDVMAFVRAGLSFKEYDTLEAMNGRDAVAAAKGKLPDLILLDLMLPDMDGMEVCRQLKADEKTKSIPIIMITARHDVADIVRGLETGANDYVTKPFDVMELVARVRTQLRLADERRGFPKMIERDGLSLDWFQRTVQHEGAVVSDLTDKEFAILFHLVLYSPKLLGRQEIFENVWGKEYKGTSRTIDVHIQRVREKIGSKLSRRIISIKGQGYKFV
ncbi:MAG TPA: response regulator transcription factor [Elusimicrobiota bacterium]|nr:response regulator transcription factor [Elusimicrobiota bacterium]